jgi:hypothetical protein
MLNVHLPYNPAEGKWITSSEQEEETVHIARDVKIAARDSQAVVTRDKEHGSFATNLINFYMPLPHYCKLVSIR